MFNSDYRFRGKHADMVRRLGAVVSDEGSIKIFNRYIDIYVLSAIIGFIYGRKAPVDSNPDIQPATIMLTQITGALSDLKFNYRLIMMLDTKNEPNSERRVDKAFKEINTDMAKADEELFESYSRGGIEVLYEKLIENSHDRDQYIMNLYEFVKDFQERFNDGLERNEIIQKCRSN